jgi:hypothetical protein
MIRQFDTCTLLGFMDDPSSPHGTAHDVKNRDPSSASASRMIAGDHIWGAEPKARVDGASAVETANCSLQISRRLCIDQRCFADHCRGDMDTGALLRRSKAFQHDATGSLSQLLSGKIAGRARVLRALVVGHGWEGFTAIGATLPVPGLQAHRELAA